MKGGPVLNPIPYFIDQVLIANYLARSSGAVFINPEIVYFMRDLILLKV